MKDSRWLASRQWAAGGSGPTVTAGSTSTVTGNSTSTSTRQPAGAPGRVCKRAERYAGRVARACTPIPQSLRVFRCSEGPVCKYAGCFASA